MAGLGALGVVAIKKPAARERIASMAQPVIERLRGKTADAPAAVAITENAPAPADEAAPAEPAEEATPAAAAEEEPAAETASADDSQADDATDQGSDSDSTADEASGDSDATDSEKTAAADPKKDEAKGDDMFSGDPVKESSDDKLESQLAEAAELMTNGAKIKAFNMYRRIGRKHMKDPRALKAWSEAAASMKGYGEALRIARRWVGVDKSVEAELHLARMQRTCGQREEAIKTLNAILKERPGQEEARSLLRSLTPEARVARR